MAQHDYDLANQAGLAFRGDLNDALDAIVSNNSGATEPSTTFAYMWWADTAAGILKRRNAADSAWISVMSLSTGLIIGTDVQDYDADTTKNDVANTFTAAQTFTKSIYEKKGADIASANDMVLLADGNYNDVTGTTTVNGMTDGVLNEERTFQFDSAVTLKHDTAASAGYSSLFMPIPIDYITAAGDVFVFRYDGTYWRCVSSPPPAYIKLSDVKADTTNGGTATIGSFETRDLNTEDHDDRGLCSLSSNQFTLAPGTYRISALAPAYKTGSHLIRLRNISDSSDTIIGSASYSAVADAVVTYAPLSGQFTITSQKTFEIQHRVKNTSTGNGHGVAGSFGVSEIYTVVELWKVA